jgi:hypothetical protein
MLLMDAISRAAGIGSLRYVFSGITEKMQLTPRYLLDDHVVQASTEIGLGRPSVLREAMRHLRIPYPRLWVEWSETGRNALRKRLDIHVTDPLKPIPERLGFLLESDGRRGRVSWAWGLPPHPDYPVNAPCVSPYDACFDLDADFPQDSDLVEAMARASLARMWEDNPVEAEALRSIWRTADHRPSEWGNRMLSAYTRDRQRFFLADVYGEYIGIWSIMLLLTAARPSVEYRTVDRTTLNKARGKRREPPLFSHTTLHLNHRVVERRASANYPRKSPRTHMVASHLRVRNGKHFIVSPYVRGSGRIVERHVRVK